MGRTKSSRFQDTKPVTDGLIFYVPFEGSVNAEYSVGTGTGTLATGNLTAIWHLEDGAGTTPDDDSGNNYDLTFSAGAQAPTWTAAGKYGSALDVTGNADESAYMAHGAIWELGNNALVTFGAWVKGPDTSTTQRVIIGKYSTASSGTGYWLSAAATTGYAYFKTQITGTISDVTGTTAIDDNEWHHVVAVRNATQLKIYVDGELENTATENNGDCSSGATFVIGSWSATATALEYEGIIDEPFFLKGIELTEGEIRNLFQSRWWGRTYLDGKFGLGYYAFEGNSLSYTANDGNIVKEQGTIDMWIKPSWDGDDGVAHHFFEMETASNVNKLTFRKVASNALQLVIEDESSNANAISEVVDSTDIAKNTWVHIAATWENGVPTKLYIDGVGQAAVGSSNYGGVLELPATMYIGRDATGQSNEAQAIIDEFKIYRRQLTAQEILQNYEAQVPVR